MSKLEMKLRLKRYVTEVLQREYVEILQDERIDPPQYDPDWKGSAIRQFRLVQLLVDGDNLARAEQAVAALAAHLSEPNIRRAAGHVLPAPAPAQPQPGRATDVARGLGAVKDPSFGSLWQKLPELSGKLESPDPAERERGVSSARGKDKVYTPSQGPILRHFIAEYRTAILGLVRKMEGCHALFSLERGGSLLADLLVKLGGLTLQSTKVAKPTQDEVKASLVNDQATERKQKQITAMLANPEEQKAIHIEKFKAQIMKFVAGQEQEQITIAVAETVVGGGSANSMVGTLHNLCDELRQHQPTKRVTFKLLLARETIKNRNQRGRGTLNVADPVNLENAREGVLPPPVTLTDNPNQVEIFLSQTRYLLGEDVDYQVKYAGENSDRPVLIFEGQAQDVVVLRIGPTAPTDTSRMILIDLIAGVYDQLMQEVFAAPQKQAITKET